MDLLAKRLIANGYGIYLTDAFSDSHIGPYAEIMRQEIDLVLPDAIVCLGRRAERMCRKIGLPDILALPHLSGTARGAIVRKFPKLGNIGATAGNIAEEYAREIAGRMTAAN